MNNMKKIKVLLAACSGILLCNAQSEIKIRGGAFIPTASLFKDIYGRAAGNVQLEAATHLYRCVDLWANIDWYGKNGHSVGLCLPTQVNVINGSIGLKVPWNICDAFALYAGVGPSFGGIRLKNRTPFCCEKVSKGAVGAVFKTGSTYTITDRAFLDIYVDYLYQPVHFQSKVNIGGFKIGAGLGWTF